MTLQQIYDLALSMGMKADPRGQDAVNKFLKQTKKDFEKLEEKTKKYFDKETLTNPYSDSRILYGDPKLTVKKILVGIDTDAAEVLLADRLNQKGAKIDLVIGHHPIGVSLAALHDVMDLQVDAFANIGVPVNVADSLMKQRIGQIKRKIHPSNHNQILDAARLLEVPIMNLHTVWDNMGDEFMRNYLSKKSFTTIDEIIDYLMEVPEYQEAAKGKNGPEIVSGGPKSRAGKIAVFFTGGTNPSKEMYIELAKAGVGTLIDMHAPDESVDELKKLNVNVINAGHMASDSIGANLFLDEIEKKGIEVLVAGGLIRVKRSK